jgi:hypothetical protein
MEEIKTNDSTEKSLGEIEGNTGHPEEKAIKEDNLAKGFGYASNNTAQPILITGCARSGTSLVAGIINLCGAWGGTMAGPNRNNKKGMFENLEIRNGIVKPYLTSIGADPMGQDPLPNLEDLDLDYPLHPQVIHILKRQGLPEERVWMYKGAKMCLVWPIWRKAFPEATWIIVRRPTPQIIDSCMRTSFMRKRHNRPEWRKWVKFHEKKFEEMKASISNVHEIWSNEIVGGNLNSIRKLVSSVPGLEWNEEAVQDFVSPELWNRGRGE